MIKTNEERESGKSMLDDDDGDAFKENSFDKILTGKS